MKTRSAIVYISILFLILVVAFFYAFQKATQSKNKMLLANRYSELKKSTTTLFETNNRNFENFILENTYDKDLKKAISEKDTSWLLSNFVPTLSSYNVDCVWILTSNADVLFSKDGKNANPLFPIDKNTFSSIVLDNPYKNFYANIGTVVTQMVIAPMEFSEAINGKTNTHIFLVFGKKYDKPYLNNLSEISTGASFSTPKNGTLLQDTINTKQNIISYHYKLTDFSGNDFATLQSTKVLTEITVYNDYFTKYSLIYLSLFLLLGIAYYKFLGAKVLKPISILSDALNSKDGSFLKKLKVKHDEFGHIAMLLDNSFDNTKKLNTEIDRRIKSENELNETLVNLEKATIEKVRAEQDKKAKGDFLSTMSHEIRTPINGVIGIANLLKTEDLNASQHDLVDTLVFSSNYLLSILTDILDFSKIEAGNLTFDNVQFSLKEICKNVQALNQANAKNKNLLLMLNTDDTVAEYLEGDSLRLCQILNNLIGNAIKFTNTGNVTLGYRLLKKNGKNQTIEFTIQDSGIGIAADKLDTIFDSFSQADKTISTNYGGTGLGLTISKKLVEMQGGSIFVTSELNEGTVFTFLLSFNEVNTILHKAQKFERKNATLNLNGLNVLVAEDNNINATILHKFLQKWSVKMDLAINGKEVLEKLDKKEYDLVLMDLHMPVMGGEEATKNIRNNENASYKSIPIIALTADATTDTQKTMLASGFDDYITKPFNPDKLYNILEQYSSSIISK
jgi:signal transduction histidine kinase/ActR/RegA family two-component response regulator